MLNPETNIGLHLYKDEVELREKVDIHRARLHRFGRSKLNGEMLFMKKNGEVYKCKLNGKKEYV